MNFGAWIMFLIGAIGLWGGLIFFIRTYFAGAREEGRAGEDSSA